MSKIVIRVPKNKEAIYAAVNAANTASQIGASLGVSYAKEGLYKGALESAPIVFDNYSDKLRTVGSQYDNNLILKSSDGTQIEFIDAKIDVTRQNKIVETSLVYRSGKVKELIQKDDYNITVKGNLIGDKDKFPYVLLDRLLSILEEPESFDVANVYLESFGICKVVLKDVKFNQGEQKFLNAMPFTLTLVSDEDYNFLITEE